MSELVFWLIRHAESTWNADGRWQGHADPPLSARGQQQATELAAALSNAGIDLLLASDLTRTAQTASILGRQLGLEPRHEAGLREIDAGRWSGFRRQEIARQDADALARFDTGDIDAPAGGGESRRGAAARVRAVLTAVAADHPAGQVAVVTHSGVIDSLLPGSRVGHARWTVSRAERILRRS